MTLDTIAAQLSALKTREVSSVELTQYALDRIGSTDDLNAFITVDADGALAQARNADAARAAGRASSLTGIPIAHKDVLMTAGLRTTCASRMLADFVAPYDAHLVEGLKREGSVLVGKTNMDEFAMGSSCENSYFGPVRNPWNQKLVPGGSSGGSAVAVAAGLIAGATGTDTGGSIRQPASFTGVTGLKPTYGLCSRYGLVAFASSLDTPGVFAHTAHDCALLLDAIAGHDARDATSIDRPREDYVRAAIEPINSQRPLAGIRVGVPAEYVGHGVDGDVASAVADALDTLRNLGATLIDIALPAVGHSVPAYYVIAPAEASSNLSRFDGVRYGHRAAEYRDLTDMYRRTRAEGFGAEVKRRILVGTYVLSHGYYDAYYLQAQKVRRLIADDFQRAFRDVDLIAGPVAPTAAFPIGEASDDPVKLYLGDIFTVAANLTGVPAMSIPAGFTRDGRPIGLQLQANHFREAQLLAAAHRFQQATDWHTRRPPSNESNR
ncbi:MAG TPA: Asp-tRNA(Asn)/Glu-tRNA(Gln) amidotransferase subunit GatA [Casimicrobiaceae bacterium]|nr:Asp-tRNA(Asn)/Glu-tRNA(Gln) amidotransferase subunit GatA [Casimicrobiaceae bacterium]